MAELGDLTSFFKTGSAVQDLDWLDVDAEQYRAQDTLPKQNLDMVPDLEALWRHKDEPASNFVPNLGEPKTMGDLSQLHGNLRDFKASTDIVRTARLAVMQSTDPAKIRHALTSRYDRDSLIQSKQALSEVFTERGRLGKTYIAANDFPDCATGQQGVEFVRKFASEAKFILPKKACGTCPHHKVESGSNHCGVFLKKLVEYDTPGQMAVQAQNLVRLRSVKAESKAREIKASEIVGFLRRELLKGRNEAELAQGLKISFSYQDLNDTSDVWAPTFKEAGLYGAVYTTQESFSDCHEGADFVHKHSSSIRAVVAGTKCGTCFFNKAARCLLYGRPLVASAEELYTEATVQAVVSEHRIAGKLPQEAARMSWGSTPVEALRSIHKAASTPLASLTQSVRSNIEQAFYGNARPVNADVDPMAIKIVKTASQYLNEGLYGRDLVRALRQTYALDVLLKHGRQLKATMGEEGLQGFKYIDPTVYDDYGKGCDRVASLYRSRSAIKYAKLGDKCSSCVHHTRVGHCSVLNKTLVLEPPYIDKQAEQQAILNSGPAMERPSDQALMASNGLSMMQEYQLQNYNQEIELAPEPVKVAQSVMIGRHEIKL